MTVSIYTVSQVSAYLREIFDTDPLLASVYVTGEASNVSVSSKGHRYFALKDADSQLQCVMFRDGGLGGEHVVNGASVTVHGRIGLYPARGELQLYADLVQPEGVGEMHLEFLRLRAKLEGEGLFDPARKRQPPAFPRRIAVVTSRQSAVWHDVQTVVGRRYPVAELLLVHAVVQGDYAVGDLVAALRDVDRSPGIDVVIVARGGGSQEELRAFNDEAVARAIYACGVPVVSAVGHETDTTIADLVADARAPTPSAAAELVTPDRAGLKRRLAELASSMAAMHAAHLQPLRHGVEEAGRRVRRLAPDVETHRQRIDEMERAAAAVIRRELGLWREQLRGRTMQLSSLRPQHTLRRGYALVERRRDGRLVSTTADVVPGERLEVQVSDGSFPAEASGAAPLSALPAKGGRRKQSRPSPPEQLPMWR